MLVAISGTVTYSLMQLTSLRWQCRCGNPYIIATDSRCALCGVQIRSDYDKKMSSLTEYICKVWVDEVLWETVNILNVTHLSSEKAFKYIEQHAQKAEEDMTPNTKQ